ncbi:MAG: 16S rRNA (guanine(527)-N(7))-methyltransferase RsmG [Candidatus Eisenbacteria bacterium]
MTQEALRDAILALRGRASDDEVDRLAEYCRLLRRVGRGRNLVSANSLERLEEHVVDCASLLSATDVSEESVGDLGSGAGLPGIVLAVLCPAVSVSLIDARRSKVVFLRQAVRELGLRNTEIVHERLENLVGKASFDMAVSRALGSIDRTLATSLALLSPGGRLVLYKGPKWPDERARAEAIGRGAGAELVGEVDVELPGLHRTTTFVTFRS